MCVHQTYKYNILIREFSDRRYKIRNKTKTIGPSLHNIDRFFFSITRNFGAAQVLRGKKGNREPCSTVYISSS